MGQNPLQPAQPITPVTSEAPQPQQTVVQPTVPEHLPQERPKLPDNFKGELNNPDHWAQQMLKKSGDLPGRQIDFRQVPSFGAEHAQQQPKNFYQSNRPPLTQQQYRQLSQDPFFRQPHMRDSPTVRYLQVRSGTEYVRADRVMVNRQDLARMISYRNALQPENRPLMRDAIRQAIKEMKKGLSEADSKRADIQEKQASFEKLGAMGEKFARLGDGSFDTLLREAINGLKLVPEFIDGQMKFVVKNASEWKAFFANLMNMGNAESTATLKMNQLVEALFRGVYESAEAGQEKIMTLVSDLSFMEGEQQITEKFARILVDHPDLLKQLQTMEPGDKLSAEMLSKTLGDEIKFTQTTHTTENQQQNAQANLNHMRSQMNHQANERLERAIKEERKLNQEKSAALLSGGTPFVPMAAMQGKFYDPTWEKQKRLGKPKWWLIFLAGLAITLFGLFVFWAVRNL